MLSLCTGEVKKVVKRQGKAVFLKVEIKDGVVDAVAYLYLFPSPEEGDVVVLNSTAVDLGLGSGGVYFVIGELFKAQPLEKRKGHLMKLRYTPLQFAVSCVEESERQAEIEGKRDIAGAICFVAELVSQVPPLVFGLRQLYPAAKIAYIMIDSACLPLSFIEVIEECKQRNYIDTTLTYGHGFGGDLETVSLATALLSARYIENAELIVLSQGIGGVGMESQFGFSALELVSVLQMISFLQGRSIFVPRVSFAEKRDRHRGISAHTHAILNMFSTPLSVAFPDLSEEEEVIVLSQLQGENWSALHYVERKDVSGFWRKWREVDWGVTSMGRGSLDDPVFFQTSLAAALLCKEMRE